MEANEKETDTNDVLDFIIENFEGTKFVDHPDDNGGPTKFGITKKTLSGFRGKSVLTNDVHELTRDEAKKIYCTRYVEPVCGDEYSYAPLRLAVIDYAIHSGTRRVTRVIQEIVETKRDGILGPITLQAIFEFGERALFVRLMSERLVFLTRLVSNDPTQSSFIYGWGKRIALILDTSA